MSKSAEQPLRVSDRLIAFAQEFDPRFRTLLTLDPRVPGSLREAVLYAALSPGKRVRPYLVVECCRICDGVEDEAWPVAAAMECVHAFSLIHDDLPAMDDDDFRRGRPTCHKQFGEALAILAGDALLALSFEILTREIPVPSKATALVRELSEGTGWAGMIGGQAADILSEGLAADRAVTQSIHDLKTASLFRAACRMGAVVANAGLDRLDRIGRFGQMLGQAFQIADDLLDLAQSSGGNAASDLRKGKQTLPACVGIEESRAEAQRLADKALEVLEPFGPKADQLRELTRFSISRGF